MMTNEELKITEQLQKLLHDATGNFYTQDEVKSKSLNSIFAIINNSSAKIEDPILLTDSPPLT